LSLDACNPDNRLHWISGCRKDGELYDTISFHVVHSFSTGIGTQSIILSLLPQLPKDYKVVLLKNEFGDIEGAWLFLLI
jgi:hypothetical protein